MPRAGSMKQDFAATVTVAGEFDLSAADQADAATREAEETEVNRIVVDLFGHVLR
jgi:hypothetical protein